MASRLLYLHMNKIITFLVLVLLSVHGVATTITKDMSTTAFILATPSGPVNRVVRIKNLDEFIKNFMGKKPEVNLKDPAYLQVKQYFKNGGITALIARVPLNKKAIPLAKNIIGESKKKTGIYAFSAIDDFSQLVIPELNNLQDKEARTARKKAIKFVKGRDAFLIMDTPSSLDFKETIAWRDNTPDLMDPINQSAALYYGRVVVDNISLGVSGSMAGILSGRGPWEQSANVAIKGIDKIETRISESQQLEINSPVNGVRINSIREFQQGRVIAWGSRTVFGDPDGLTYIHSQRMSSMLRGVISMTLDYYKTSPNNATTWLLVKAVIQNYLTDLWVVGALTGGPNASNAFDVSVGLGSTMRMEDVLEGRMIVQVRVALEKSDHYIELVFLQMMMNENVKE